MLNYNNTRESGYTLSFPLSLLERALGNCEVRLVRCDDDPYIKNERNLKIESVDFGYQNDSNSESRSYQENYGDNKIPSVDSPFPSGSCTSISFKNCPYTEFKLILVHDQEVNEGWKKEGNDQVYYANYNRHITVDPQKKVEAVPERNTQYKCQLRRVKGKYQCIYCKKIFSNKYNAERHQRQIHSLSSRQIQEPDLSHGIHKCTHCEKYFAFKESLEKHIITVHVKARPYVCSLCPKRFIRKDHLQMHMLRHTDGKPYKCLECGKQFTTASDLLKHKKNMHSGSKPYNCNICGKGFISKTKLQDHLRVHTNERPFKCLQCGKRFKTGANLTAHKASIHSGIRPHKCNTCEKAFTFNNQLKTHLRVHTNERPFKCLQCSKRFKTTTQLSAHKKSMHSGIKPHLCNTCGKAFTFKYHMQAHILRVHSKGKSKKKGK